MGIEFELKFRIGGEAMEALAESMGPCDVLDMETAYYDTPDGALSRRHYTLRRRMESGKSVCTLKTPAGGSARNEWEVECPAIEEAIPMLCKLGCPEILPELVAEGLVQTCGARFRRRFWKIAFHGSTLELALDQGILMGSGREIPLRELEIELKEGTREAAVSFASLLTGRYGLEPESKSKFRRAYDLAREVR
jgi:inorganic triphosphatase YgiF